MSADRAALLNAFRRRFARPPALVAEAPGRAADGLLAVFNWADEADVSVGLPVAAARLADFWTGDEYDVQRGTATFRGLPPHGSELLKVHPTEA